MHRPNHRSMPTSPARPWRLAALALAWLTLAGPEAARASYAFTTIVNPIDPTFNQELGINNSGQIAGYYGNGMANPNKGYFTTRPRSPSGT
jgi:hypothetical protein